jgi:hypothetical protein
VHLLFGFVGIGNIGQLEAGRGFAFGNAAANRKPLANAWLESAYTWRNDNQTNRPIAIAAGVSREDAINRRENETLDYRDINIPSTNWLAWKWRA